MNSLTLWRTVAIIASLGWGLTILAWVQSTPEPAPEERRAETQRPRAKSPVTARRANPTRRPRRATPAQAPDLNAMRDEVRDEVRNEVLDEIEQERAERREHHLTRLLDEITAFAEEHELPPESVAALESSMGTMHDRLEEARPDGPPGPGGPPAEVMEAIETAFEQFQGEVAEVLDDPELADLFTERMTPRPLRRRRGPLN